jgi:hypothetical protein
VGAFGAQGGVVAVAGVDPGLVREFGEDPGFHVVEEAAEGLGVVVGVADAAGEYRRFCTGNIRACRPRRS